MKKFLAFLLVFAMILPIVPMISIDTTKAETMPTSWATVTKDAAANYFQFMADGISVSAGDTVTVLIHSTLGAVKTNSSIRTLVGGGDITETGRMAAPSVTSIGGNWYEVTTTSASAGKLAMRLYFEGQSDKIDGVVSINIGRISVNNTHYTFEIEADITAAGLKTWVSMIPTFTIGNASQPTPEPTATPVPTPVPDRVPADPQPDVGKVFMYDLVEEGASTGRATVKVASPVIKGDIISFWVKFDGSHGADHTLYELYARYNGTSATLVKNGKSVTYRDVVDAATAVTGDGWYYIECVAANDAATAGNYELAIDAGNQGGTLSSAMIADVRLNGVAVDVTDYVEKTSIDAIVAKELSVTLGTDLAVNVYAYGIYATEVEATFTLNGNTSTLVGVKENEKSATYKFVFEGISPELMADTLTVSISADDNVVATGSTTLEAYLNAIDVEGNAELEALVNDVLVYGGAAQEYRKYNTENLVSDGVTGTVFDITGVESVKGTTSNANGYNFISANLWFDYSNAIIFKFAAADVEGVTLKVNGSVVEFEEVEDGVYKAISNHIAPTDFDETYTAVLTDAEDNELATATYSVNSYVVNMSGSNNVALTNLVKALYNYGVSAEAYKAAN